MSYGYFGAVNLLGGNSNAFTDGLPLDITDPLVLQSVPSSSVIISGTDGTLSGVNYGSASSANSIVQRDVNGNIIINKANMLSLTAGMVLVSDSSKNVISSSVSATTLSYLDATSSVQTQLNSKMALSSGLTSGDHLIATSSNTIGNSSIISESGSNLYVAGSINLTPSADGIIVIISNHSGSDIFQINSSTGLVSSLINFLVGGSYGTASTTSFQVSTRGNVPVFTVDNSTPQINIGTNIVPTSNNVDSLGISGTAFSKLWTQNANIGSLTVSTALVSDASNNIISSSTTSTELSYVHGVTSAIQTQLNGKQASLSGLTSGDYIKATGSSSIGNASILSESGSALTALGNIYVNPASDGTAFTVNKSGGSQAVFEVNTATPELILFDSTASTNAVLTTSSGNLHLSGGLQTVGNVTINPASDGSILTITNHAGSNVFNVNTSSNLTTVSTPTNNGASFQVLNSSGNAVFGVGTTGPSAYINNDQGAYLLYANNSVATGYVGFGAPTYGSSTVYDNIYIQKNIMSPGAGPGSGVFALGSSSRFFGSIYVNNIIGNGTILYNNSNSSAGTGYPTMDSLYTYEYVVTASNISASYSPVGGFIPFPSGKSGYNLRKLEIYMYDGTYFVPPVFGIVGSTYAYAIATSPSGIFIQTGSTWTQTTGTKTFYVWITTN